MRHTDAAARSRVAVPAHSLGRTLLVALVLSLAPLAVLAVVGATGLVTAFVAGALSAVAVALLRRRRATGSAPGAPSRMVLTE